MAELARGFVRTATGGLLNMDELITKSTRRPTKDKTAVVGAKPLRQRETITVRGHQPNMNVLPKTPDVVPQPVTEAPLPTLADMTSIKVVETDRARRRVAAVGKGQRAVSDAAREVLSELEATRIPDPE